MQHQGNDLGDGNSVEDAPMDNPQPTPTAPLPGGAREAVQRLDVSGFAPLPGAGLRYSLMSRRKACLPHDALKVAKCLVIKQKHKLIR